MGVNYNQLVVLVLLTTKKTTNNQLQARQPAMRGLLLTAAAFLVATAAVNAAPQLENLKGLIDQLSGDDAPGQVSGYEQVPYTTVQKFNGYEEREYPALKWACAEKTYPMEEEDGEDDGEGGTNVLKMMMEMIKSGKDRKKKPSNGMFMKLFRYISGVNQERQKIEMTVPVLMEKTPHEDGTMTTDMCFYIEKKFQANPPQPEEEGVRIVETKPMTVFVHVFPGYAMKDRVWEREAAKFEEKLKDDGRNDEVVFSGYFTASYDSPMKFWNRRNEVMFLKKPTTI